VDRRLILGIILFALGVTLCVPALRIAWWVWSVGGGNSDVSLAGFDVAVLFSAIGGGTLVGSIWALYGVRR